MIITFFARLCRIWRLHTTPLSVVLVALVLSGCGPDMTLMSEQQEAQIGAREHQKIIKAYGGIYDDPGVNAYVNHILEKVAAASDRPDIKFRVTVLDSSVINAFALPGGYTYVTRGLLALANSEAEVAAVIGHEIGHVTARHSAQRQTAALGTAVLAGVIGAVANSQAPGSRQAVNDLLNIGGTALLAGYSRSQEYEADDIGVRTSAKAGYQPEAAADFLQSLGRESAFEKEQSGGKSAPEWLSTHPSTDERVARAREISAPYFLDRASFQTGHATHLKAINGIVYGDSAKHGYVAGQSFIHPHLKMRFSVPKGFVLENSDKAVVATDPKGNAITFDTAKTTGSIEDYVAQHWIRGEGAERRSLRVAGYPALRLVLNLPLKYQEALAVKTPDGQVYRFLVAREQNDKGRTMDFVIRSLQVHDTARAVRPLQIQVQRVRDGQTVSALAQKMIVPNNAEKRFRLLNGLSKGAVLKAGQDVKLIQ